MPDYNKYDPVVRSIIEGGTEKNPLYNPKTKKGKEQSPTLINLDSRFNKQSMFSGLAKSYDSLSYSNEDLGLTTEEYKEYNDYGVSPSRYDTIDDLNAARARKQSAIKQLGNSLAQIGINELVIGVPLGFSNIIDGIINTFSRNNNDFTNPISEELEKLQEKVKKEFAIYRQNPNDAFNIGDFGWWADNFVSVGSTLSLLIPAAGVAKGASTLGRLTKLNKVFSKGLRGVAEAAHTAQIIKHPATFAKTISKGSGQVATALFSRIGEGYQEAREVYKESYTEVLDTLHKMSSEDKTKLLSRNKEFENKTDEEIAHIIAGKSANTTYKNDFAMLLFDVPQVMAIGKILKGSKFAPKLKTRIANSKSIKDLETAVQNSIKRNAGELVDDEIKSSIFKQFLNNRTNELKTILKHPLTTFETIQAGEAFEEMYQGIQTEIGKEVGKKILDPKYTERDLASYLSDPHIWEQGVWGMIGGLAFGGFYGGLTETIQKRKRKAEYEKQYGREYKGDEDLSIAEINSRKAKLDAYIANMELINVGKNPYSPTVDEFGIPKLVDGRTEYQVLEENEKNAVKEQLTKDFLMDITLSSAKVGNYKLLKDFIGSDELRNYLIENKIVNPNELSMTSNMIDIMDSMFDLYENTVANAANSIIGKEDDVQYHILDIIGRQAVRQKTMLDNLNSELSNIDIKLQETGISDDTVKKEENYILAKELKDILLNYDKILDELNKDLANKKISQQTYDKIIKDLNKETDYLQEFIKDKTTIIPEDIKHSIKIDDKNKKSINTFIKELNKFFDKFNEEINEEQNNIPNNIYEIIKDKTYKQFELYKEEKSALRYKKDYQQRYNEIHDTLESMAGDKVNSAYEQIKEFINKHDDLDKVYEDLITNNVDEKTKKALDIAILGHPSTEQLNKEIKKYIEDLKKERTAEKKEAEKVTVNGEEVVEKEKENVKEEITKAEEEQNKKTVDKSEPIKPDNNIDVIIDEQGNRIEVIKNFDENYEDTAPEISPEQEDLLRREAERYNKEQEDLERMADSMPIPFDDYDTKEGFMAALDILIKMFKVNKELFTKANEELNNGITNGESLNKILNNIRNELMARGFDKKAATKDTIDAFKNIMTNVEQLHHSKNTQRFSNLYKVSLELANRITIENSDDLFSISGIIADEKLDDKIEEFLDEYIKKKNLINFNKRANSRNKQLKPIINLETLFQDLMHDPYISYSDIIMIFNNIKDYVLRTKNEKYKFINKRSIESYRNNAHEFLNNLRNKKSKAQVLHDYMHIAPTNNPVSNYINIVKKAFNAGFLTVQWGRRKNDTVTKNALSFTHDGIELAFLATVNHDGSRSKFTLNNPRKGFNFIVSKNSIGNYETNFDNFIYNLIEDNFRPDDFYSIPLSKESKDRIEQNRQIFELAYKYFNQQISAEYGEIDLNAPKVTREETISLINNPIIKNLIENNNILFPEKNGVQFTSLEKGYAILNELTNILFYMYKGSEDVNTEDSESAINSYKLYYELWKKKLYENYENTYKIQQALENNASVQVKLRGAATHRLNVTEELRDITEIGIQPDIHEIVVVNSEGFITPEQSQIGFVNRLGLPVGTMGFILQSNPNAPAIATFKRANPISASKKMYKQLTDELNNLFDSYINDEICYDEITNRLGHLFGGVNFGTTSLFNGVSIINYNGLTGLSVKNLDNKYALVIKQDGSSKEFMRTKKSRIIKNLVDNLTFNRTFFPVLNKDVINTPENNKNRYIYKKDGKLVINIGGKINTYNNFGEFILEHNAFKTDVKRENGSNFIIDDVKQSLYISPEVIYAQPPVRGGDNKTDTIIAPKDPIERVIKQKSTSTAIKIDNILRNISLTENEYSIINEALSDNIPLLPDEVYYTSQTSKANAIFKIPKSGKHKGKPVIYITNKGLNLIKRNPKDALRLLIHENFHKQFNEHKIFEQQEIVDELLKTYELFIEALNNRINNNEYSDNERSQAKIILDGINKYNLTFESYFNALGLSNENITEEELNRRKRVFAEEWLVESLTQKAIVDFINKVEINDEIDVNKIEKKSIFQKIINILLKLFNFGEVKNNTILAKHYSLLAQTVSENSNEINPPINTIVNETSETENEIIEPVNDEVETETETENQEQEINQQPTVTETEELESIEEKSKEEEKTYVSDLDESNNFDKIDYVENTDDIFGEIEEDDFLSITGEIGNIEDNIETYANNTKFNPNGIMFVTDMATYLSDNSARDVQNLSEMLAENELKYLCR